MLFFFFLILVLGMDGIAKTIAHRLGTGNQSKGLDDA